MANNGKNSVNKPSVSDSGQNSMEYWDYSVELECIMRDPYDLQLAAELGKTLLERNRDLETTVHQLQQNLQDQSQEIEYLGKQNAALRQCSESRLRLCEQLEANVADLERQLQKQNTEWQHDKRKLKTLMATVEALEQKCEDLQKCVEQQQRHANLDNQASHFVGHAPVMSNHNRWFQLCQDRKLQRRHSSTAVLECPAATDTMEGDNRDNSEKTMEDMEVLREQFQDLRNQLKLQESLRLQEQCHQEILEHELAALKQENAALTATLCALRSGIQRVNSLEHELASLESPHSKYSHSSSVFSHDLKSELQTAETLPPTFPSDHRWNGSKNAELFLELDSQRLQLQDRYDELTLQKKHYPAGGSHSLDPWGKSYLASNKSQSLNEELQGSSLMATKGPEEMSLMSCDVTDAINLIGSEAHSDTDDRRPLAPEEDPGEIWSLELMSFNRSLCEDQDSGPTSLLFVEKPVPWLKFKDESVKVEQDCADSLSLMSSGTPTKLKRTILEDDEEESSSSSSSGFVDETRSQHQSTQTELYPSFAHCQELFDQLYAILRSNL